jgi:hypothetical protein
VSKWLRVKTPGLSQLKGPQETVMFAASPSLATQKYLASIPQIRFEMKLKPSTMAIPVIHPVNP